MGNDQKKLFVGNLPWEGTTEAGLRQVFEEFGTVHEVKMINDRETNRFRGFAFITMDKQSAEDAQTALDGTQFNGRPLHVNEAKERERSDRGGNRQHPNPYGRR